MDKQSMGSFVYILLIVFLISRNRKDQKKMEQEITEAEIDPENHDDGHV